MAEELHMFKHGPYSSMGGFLTEDGEEGKVYVDNEDQKTVYVTINGRLASTKEIFELFDKNSLNPIQVAADHQLIIVNKQVFLEKNSKKTNNK